MLKVFHRGAARAPGLAQGFERHIEADLVTEFETVRHGLGGTVNPQGNTLDGVGFDPLMQGEAGETDNPQSNLVRPWTPCLVAEGQPDLMRILRRQAVKIEGGEQADDAVGNLLADLSQRVVFGDVRTGRAIKLLI